jgi:hypothetical protein
MAIKEDEMKLKFLLISMMLINIGCVQQDSLVCPTAVCTTETKQIKIEFVDQNGNNLIGAKSSFNYTNDVQIYSNRFKKNIVIEIDKNLSLINFYAHGSDEFSITYNGLKSDILKVETKYNPDDCCGVLDITKLTLNNNSIAFNNAGPTIIILKK